MAQLHLLLVIDSDDGRMHVTDLSEAPVDSDASVWDDPEWREPTDEERDILIGLSDQDIALYLLRDAFADRGEGGLLDLTSAELDALDTLGALLLRRTA